MSNHMESSNGFTNWLEQELQRRVATAAGAKPLARQSVYHAAFVQGGNAVPIFSHVLSVLSAKAAVAITAAALVVGGGAGAAFATGSSSPAIWGQALVATVQDCRSALTTGQHGIGECVSTFAKQKGEQERAQHAANAAHENHPTGAPTMHPTGAPTGMPAGGPTGMPAGGPTGRPAGGPTGMPAGGPTGMPAGGPTGMPAGGPTGMPAGGPSGKP